MSTTARPPELRGLSGVLFAALFVAGDLTRRALASVQLPLPDASASTAVRYYTDNATAELAVSGLQVASALSLFVFVPAATSLIRRGGEHRRTVLQLTAAAGLLSACALLVSALLGLTLGAWSTSLSLENVDTIRTANFVSGGVVHVATLGAFVGGCTLAAMRCKTLARGIRWLGTIASITALASLLSIVVYQASVLLPVGRVLCFIWCVTGGIAFLVGTRRTEQSGARQPAET